MNSESIADQNAFFITDANAARLEIESVAGQAASGFDTQGFRRFFQDTASLFNGTYPGYRASNTRYHDFTHTVSVVLATARLVHGCALSGYGFTDRQVLLTLLAAFFHDAGLIQKSDDLQGSGAKYTVGHEERSVAFLEDYLAGKGFSAKEIQTGGDFIRCTILSQRPSQFTFATDTEKVLGYAVGSADLMAQMADRLYLEKLLLLYKEFEEARLPGFDSELNLLQKTKDFYEIVAKNRLYNELEGVCRHMRAHFRHWLNRETDGYADAIARNIGYLESIIAKCDDSFRCYLEHLKRGGISRSVLEKLPPQDG